MPHPDDSSPTAGRSAVPDGDGKVVGPEALKGLTHPLRLRLLAELSGRGRATATQLAEALGESSGATSYHLRQLFRHGLIEEDDSSAPGRQRYWRPLRGGWTLPAFDLAQETGARSAVEDALRQMIADDQRLLERVWALAPSWPLHWRNRIRRRQSHLTLGPDQVLALQHEVDALLDRYHGLAPDGDARRILVNVDILPTEFGPDGSPVPAEHRGPAGDPAGPDLNHAGDPS